MRYFGCPKCKHDVYYQYMYSGSMYRCPKCDWLGTDWQAVRRFSWQPWFTLVIGSAIAALTILLILRDWGIVQ